MIDKNRVYLLHIIECIDDIKRYTKSGVSSFLNDDMIRNATLRQLQIMSETTTRLSQDIRDSIQEVDWRKIAAFRNILVHDYLGDIDQKLVWEHIDQKLPVLKNATQRMFNKLYGSES